MWVRFSSSRCLRRNRVVHPYVTLLRGRFVYCWTSAGICTSSQTSVGERSMAGGLIASLCYLNLSWYDSRGARETTPCVFLLLMDSLCVININRSMFYKCFFLLWTNLIFFRLIIHLIWPICSLAAFFLIFSPRLQAYYPLLIAVRCLDSTFNSLTFLGCFPSRVRLIRL